MCKYAGIATFVVGFLVVLAAPGRCAYQCDGKPCNIPWTWYEGVYSNCTPRAHVGGGQAPSDCSGYEKTGNFSVCQGDTVWFRACPPAGQAVDTHDRDQCPCTSEIAQDSTTQHWYLNDSYQAAGYTWSHTFNEAPGDYTVKWFVNDVPDQQCFNDSTVLQGSFTVTVCYPCAPSVTINSPAVGAAIRGPHQSVSFSAQANTCTQVPLDRYAVYYRDIQRCSVVFPSPKPTSGTWNCEFCTFRDKNNPGALTAKVWDIAGHVGIAEQSNEVDNAYLISVTRGEPSSHGSVTWKYWSGNGWTALSSWCIDEHDDTACSGWQCTTCGNTDCSGTPGPCGHNPPHTYCHNGDTPGYVVSQRSGPRVDFGATVDYACDASFGTAKIGLEDATACCGCARSTIRIHGDQVNGSCPTNQTLACTYGCVRMQNGPVDVLYDIVTTAGARVANEVYTSVPDCTWP